MSSVGAYLRGLREKQGMSVDELSRATRVLHHYLEALETDNVGSLPAPVFTKGFIRAYCQAIGVAPDEALRLYDRMGVPAPDLTKVPVAAARVASAPFQHSRVTQAPDYLPTVPPGPPAQGQPREGVARGTLLISFVLLVVLGVAFFAVTLMLQSGRDGDGERSDQAAINQLPTAAESPTAPPIPLPPLAESVALQPPAPPPLAKPSPTAAPSVPAPNAASTPSAQAGANAPATAVAPPAPSVAAAPRVPAAPSMPPAPIGTSVPRAPATPGTLPVPIGAIAPPAAAPPPVTAPAPTASAMTARGLALPYRLIARTTETTWMRVRTEDGRTSEETIPANEIREWISNGPFVLTIGNAGGVSLELNGRPIPRLGASGSVITRMVLPSDDQ